MRLNIPTWFTIFRVISIPFFILTFYLPFHWSPIACTTIFVVGSMSDWFDGFLARRWNQTSRFGAFLDPVADKVMVAIALILIAQHFNAWWITLPTATSISREIIISALREWMAEIGKRYNIAVSRLSKIKTTAQMIALIALLWRPDELITSMGIIALYIATVLTFWSMFQYLYLARHDLFKQIQ